ncbi:double-stranded RNA-specific adenosine deaminase [Cheilinus undulatus]|uniref:double-stranded RNA-specific adenosine deaminase n=1 Tax=Cheilinus undulatus TaxID=241271 RepID=UPI001BD5CD0A|nr:double-stranded RNA-specific adenosine deaminase [Cheilinus undulatus]XP_041648762.1 double-stranded RNA-specific adenosine deaminase [Cheilinus undulatus]XP_041648763.1 double-stranded RNA-specific adenosine deaminase [Cheilinus undulatus]
MSRGRGGPSRDHFHRHPPPDLQAKDTYHRPGPATLYPRSGPQQSPFPGYYHSPGHPFAIQPSAPPLTQSALPNQNKGTFKPVPFHCSYNPSNSPTLGPNSFRQQQAEFLRGYSSEAPQFRGNPQGGGGRGIQRYPNPGSSPRGRAVYGQPQGALYQPTLRLPQGPPSPLHPNQNHNYYSNRPWCNQADSLYEDFQSLSLHKSRASRGAERFDRHSSSSTSGSLSYTKTSITLTPDIQEQVHRALTALKPGETIPAKSLAKKLHLPKSVVNRALYCLERLQRASKQGLFPPEWSLYREPVRGEEDQSSKAQSPPSDHCLSSQQFNTKAEPKTETAEYRGQTKEEHSDTDSSSSHFSSLESSDSEEPRSPAKDQQEENRNPDPANAPDQEPNLLMMAEQKELVLQYLLLCREATALVIAKNLGLKNAKQVNPTLYALEKQGEVIKNGEVNPPTWELSDRRRERMERSLKVAQSVSAEEMIKAETGGGSMFLSSSSLPPIPGLEPLPETWTPEQSQSEESTHLAPSSILCKEEETTEGQWATDDIPEFLNAIRRETDAERLAAEKGNAVGTVAVSLAAPPPQNLWAKLQELKLKNPVSGLMEYAQYLGQNCEFLLLDQSGPSHDPRFRMQVMLNGRLFPVAEASSKKIAKKDAAAATLRVLIGEMQGGGNTGEVGSTESLEHVMDLLSDTSGAAEGMAGICGSVEGNAEGPRQPLSRSLPGGKNPVSVLMEYSQRSGNPIEFIITRQVGPPHDPRFMYRVKVGENMFPEASAPSKKAARQLAAEEAVKELMADGRLQLNKPQLPLGSSSDSEGTGSGSVCPSLPPLTADELRVAHEAGVGDLINHLNNNAVSGLLEYARARGFAAEIRLVGQSGPAHEPKFTYQAKLGGRWFPPVCASNKKQGKQEAADAALRVLIGEAERAARTGELIPAELPVSGSTLHDQIAMLSHQRFNSLTTRIQHSLLGRKILATIVMRRGEGLGTVVSLGTGNRCVKGEELSLKGETVNDCHAEIISRRGFIRFLYSELLKHYDGAEDSIFEPTETNKLQIKSDITFHLYISTAPCGDGALFDKSCSEAGDDFEGHQPLFENNKQGKLRTKVENGEGTIPVESSDIVPTWDGIQHGERLRTMSCSDKIMRWNVLGLQGALLTHFLNPIYLKSITLGYLYSHGHLTRAVCCRLARDGKAFAQTLPPPYVLNHPEVGRVSVYDSTRHIGKTKESSVNWSFPDQHSVEVLDGTKGKLDGNKLSTSRVSKSNLFCLFRSLCQRCGRTDLLALPSYSQAKMSALFFQQAKQQFFRALSLHGYGAWISKPLEEKSFEAGEVNKNNGAGVPSGYGSSRNGGAMEYKQEEA